MKCRLFRSRRRKSAAPNMSAGARKEYTNAGASPTSQIALEELAYALLHIYAVG